jgi:hypothetical protein
LTDAQHKVIEQVRAEIAAIHREAAAMKPILDVEWEVVCRGRSRLDPVGFRGCQEFEDKVDSLRAGMFARYDAAKKALLQANFPPDVWLSLNDELFPK